MIHPKLQRSEAWSYDFSTNEISGALYHLEPTCSDMSLFISFLRGLSLVNISLITFYFLGYKAQMDELFVGEVALLLGPDVFPSYKDPSDKFLCLPFSILSNALFLNFSVFKLFKYSSGLSETSLL
jgi:hypothetical protein